MAFFALLWKARTIEKYRHNYEKEKINSIVMGHTQMEQTLSQRWRHYRYDTKKRISRTFKKWYPDGSSVANFFLYLKTDQTFPNFLLKSVMGFVGGIILTYLCFMFFVFQLSISLIHATIMSSIIGVLLTLGLAFSYRIRCLVFLLIPQFFSRVGRYTLTCYALVLILTGPATNTLKNSEVLSESMACSQEQIKTSVHQVNDLLKKPYNAIRDSIKPMIDRLKMITMKVKETVVSLDRLVLSLVGFIQSAFSWLQSVADICNANLGTPYDRCNSVLQDGIADCQKTLGREMSMICDVVQLAQVACYSVKPFTAFCYVTDFMDEAIMASVKKKLRNFTEQLRAMFHVEVHLHHTYSFSSNTSRSASQVTAGIVTEIRNRADPLLTWLSWSSCVTSLFLLLIIFRAKYYQHMYETRSRFDNRYVTKELQELDLKRQRQGRETVLPLNRRERAKYITTTSFRLVASEKVYLNRSAVFMAITTFKLLIHMVADYSLYWVLMTIRYHGRYQSDLMPGIPHSGVHVSGSGFVARLFRSIIETLDIPLASPAPSPISCLPDPYPPDLRRYTQIGVLIFLLWFFALFEPYGLRLRHLIMGHYSPERAKARATWLYNHILRTRAGFMKFARRKLHREYKYSSEASLTFRQWMKDHIPFQWLKSILGLGPKEPHCLLCGTNRCHSDPDTHLTRCQTPKCPGIFCMSCFTDIGQLCTICLTPVDYGDYSDVSLEKGSSDDSDSDDGLDGQKSTNNHASLFQNQDNNHDSRTRTSDSRRWWFFTRTGPMNQQDTFSLLPRTNNYDRNLNTVSFRSRLRKIKSNMKIRNKHYTQSWVSKLTLENNNEDFSTITYEENYDFYANTLDIEQYGEFDECFKKTRSVGINTDKKRSLILNTLFNSFSRRKIKRSHINNKQQRTKSDVFQIKTVSQFNNRVRFKEHRNITPNVRIVDCYNVKPHKSWFPNKKLHAHDLKTCQKNLMKIVKCNKKYKTKDKIKIYTEVKGTIKAMRYFMKSNDISSINQNNDMMPNNSPDQNNDEIIKPSDNTRKEGKKNKKKTSKFNKPKKPKKIKNCNKIRTPNSRHRIAEFHTFFSNHWNNFKYSIMPCTQNRSDSPMTKERKNHKRRKKRKAAVDVNETDIEECFARKDIKHTRNLRISAFLAELEWTKRDYKKGNECEVNEGSFFLTDGVPAPVKANRIVGMVQLKNLPFQWREAPRLDYCNCQDKKCTCQNRPSQKCLKLFGHNMSKQKVYAKKALERFRNKINTVDTPPSSLVEKVMSTINAPDKPPNDSSICISKRPSYYQSFTQELTQDSDMLDTDMLFKNEHYLDDLMQDTSQLKKDESSKLTATSPEPAMSVNRIGKELIISRSSKDKKAKGKPKVTKKCRCDLYEDLSRRWTHVKKTLSDRGLSMASIKNPLSTMKNFCSSLFGPSCTIDTCPNKLSQKQREKLEKAKAKTKKKDAKKAGKKAQTATQTTPKNTAKKNQKAVQTRSQKDIETQLESETDLNCEKKIQEKLAAEREKEENLSAEHEKESLAEERAEEERLAAERAQEERLAAELAAEKRLTALREEQERLEEQRKEEERLAAQWKEEKRRREEEAERIAKMESERLAAEQEEERIAANLEKERRAMERDLKKLIAIDKKKNECAKERKRLLECHESIKAKILDTDVRNNDDVPGQEVPVLKVPAQKPVEKGMTAAPDKATGACQAVNCPNSCNQYVQYDKTDAQANVYEKTKAVGSVKCLCDREVQSNLKVMCTCATQHQDDRKTTGTLKPSPVDVRSFMVDAEPIAVLNKKIQHRATKNVAHKATHYTVRKLFDKKFKDAKSGVSKRRKLSLESGLCVIDRDRAVAEALQEVLTDTITDTSMSSMSLRSDETKTDTTICSLATVDFDDTPRRRKFRVKVVTKTNQATITDKTRLCDTGTITSDWWSPIVERKEYDEILLEKKKGYNAIEKQKKELRELKEWKELREVRKRRRTCGVTTDGRIVTFRSRTQIIPTGLFPITKDIMSPSRYLLESQKYYNELFSYNFRPPAQADYACFTQLPKYYEREKTRSPLGSRRNHHRKTKRLDECYSPRRQVSPRKRHTDSSKTIDSHKRAGHGHRHSRHHSKYHSPRK